MCEGLWRNSLANGDAAASDYASREYRYNRLMEPAPTAAVAALNLRATQRVLDAGYGPGGAKRPAGDT